MIRRLNKNDLPLAKALIELWLKDDEVENPKLPPDKYLEKLLHKDDFYIFVAMEGDQVVGGLTAYEIPMFYREENEMFLFEIGVSREYRKQGIATALIKALKTTCLEKGIKIIFLGTSVDNEAALALYKATGGEIEIIPWVTYELK